MKEWIPRYELAPATTAKMANRTTCGSLYIRPWARRGSGMVRRRSSRWVNVVMATPAG